MTSRNLIAAAAGCAAVLAACTPPPATPPRRRRRRLRADRHRPAAGEVHHRAARRGPLAPHRERAADDPAPDRRRARDGRHLLDAGVRRPRRPAAHHPGPEARRATPRSTTARGTGWTTTRPFIAGAGPSPTGANYYPAGMTKAEFERRGRPRRRPRRLAQEPLHGGAPRRGRRADRGPLPRGLSRAAAARRRQAARGRRRSPRTRASSATCELRATRCSRPTTTRPSDLAWMDMKNNTLDIVIGPIETYEDAAVRLQGGQRGVRAGEGPGVEPAAGAVRADAARRCSAASRWRTQYKRETPGTDADLNAYDAVYYAGEANVGRQDHRHQPAQRRAGAAAEGHAPAAAQERDAGQVRRASWCPSPAS